MRYPEKSPLPAPLPPEQRTVGQLIAETVKLYMERFWVVLALGLVTVPPDLIANANGGVNRKGRVLIVLLLAQAPCFAAGYVAASRIVLRRSVPFRRLALAYVLALAIYLVAVPMIWILVLPGLAWLALVGLAVPAFLAEDADARQALRRGVDLARADYAHVLGGICALVLVFLVTRGTLATLLHSQGGNTARAAGIVADVVLFPLVFLGSALLYVDQTARLRVRGVKAAAVA
jgi:hypothetical protein